MKIKNTSNLWDAAQVVHRGKFIALNADIRKGERSQIINFSFDLKKLGKKEEIEKQCKQKKGNTKDHIKNYEKKGGGRYLM